MELCTPAIIFIIFSLIQIIIDIIKGYFNTALIKLIVMIIITFLLNLLCIGGLTILSWIIVFIPFIFMTVIITLLLYVFGLNATTGTFKRNLNNASNNITIDKDNNIIVYDPYDNYEKHPAYYKNPNIFIPNPNLNSNPNLNFVNHPNNLHSNYNNFPNWNSSDPSYKS
jgi:ABC-type transport system involved in Fe-S cluster assembly fused permease/ATPase subunit